MNERSFQFSEHLAQKNTFFFCPVCILLWLYGCFQVCPSGWCSASVAPGSTSSGCFALCCWQTGSQLCHLCHHPCVQDGSDVHVWPLSGMNIKSRVRRKKKLLNKNIINISLWWIKQYYKNTKSTLLILSDVMSVSHSHVTTQRTSPCSHWMMWTQLSTRSCSWNTHRSWIWKVKGEGF